jgi:DNA repair exonuclease SbcCD nuclease subunit
MSFAQRAMPDSLVPRYPPPVEGALNIGLLHTSADGRPGHHPYAPCRVEELVQKGYDYWALGHVHAHEVLHQQPWIVFSGNTQGRHVREAGKKGCVVVSVEGREIRAVKHEPLDVVRWRVCEVMLDGSDDLEGMRVRVRETLAAAREEADGRMLAARLVVRGAAAAHATIVAERARVEGELRALAFEWKDEVWIEEIDFRTRPPLDFDALRESDGFVGELLRAVQAARSEPALLEELALGLAPLYDKLGDEVTRAGLDLGERGAREGILDEAEALLAARLTEETT